MGYRIGYYYERRTKEILEREGYDVWRSPASKSPIDIIAIKPDKDRILVKFIQVKAKKNGKVNEHEIGDLKDFAERYKNYDNVSVELWIYNRENRKVEKINIK